MSEAPSVFPDGTLCVMDGLTCLGTNDPDVQIFFPDRSWIVHLSQAQFAVSAGTLRPAVKCSCLMVTGVHLKEFVQKGLPMKQASRAEKDITLRIYTSRKEAHSVLSSEDHEAARIPALLPCPELAGPRADSSCTGLLPRSRVDTISQHLFPFNLLFIYILV